ncbi:MAG: hypothetical protein J5762_02355 [Clostridia bacterium]|nr:hypothetical protein [Clostridia bacterium]
MTRKEIFDKLKQIVADVKNVDISDFDGLTEESDIKQDIGLNSIGMLYVVIKTEKEFGFSMSDFELDGFTTVKDVVDVIEESI